MAKTSIITAYQKDIAQSVATTLGISKKDATTYTEAVVNSIIAELLAGHKVNLSTLGIFQVKDIPARMVRVPSDGSTRQKEGYKKLTFKSTKPMKTRLS